MNHELNAAMAILSGSLRPWVKENQDEEKFKQLLNHNVRAQKDNGAPFFTALISAYKKTGIGIEHEIIREFSDLEKAPRSAEIIDKIAPFEFPAFFNKQTEFYTYLIRNEFFGTLLYVDHLVRTMEAIDARYNIQKVFKMIGSILGQLNEVTHTDKTTVFILDNLRISLYFIHQELKRLYSDYIDFEILSENELIYQLATDNNDEKSRIAGFINQYKASLLLFVQEEEISEKPIGIIKTEKPVSIFEARESDFRGTGRSPVRYEDIINSDEFSKVEKELYESKIIDENYDFIKHRDNKKLLAEVYHILIQKNYFRKRSFKHTKEFTSYDYRQYLDVRYNVETNQQFRRCKEVDIEECKNKYAWVENIPQCRESTKSRKS